MAKTPRRRIEPSTPSQVHEKARAESRFRVSENLFRTLWETTTDPIVLLDEHGLIQYANPAIWDVFGYEPSDVVGKGIEILQPPNLRAAHRAGLARYLRTGIKTVNWRSVEMSGMHRSGREFPIELTFSRMDFSGKPAFAGFIRDITDRKHFQATLAGQKEVLQLIASGASLDGILNSITQQVETQFPEMLCSILRTDESGTHLLCAATSSFPEAFNVAINGQAIGPSSGSCGTAAYRKELVVVQDIGIDPLWSDFRDVALSNNLRACWSHPIVSHGGRVLGTLAMYYRQPRTPAALELDTIKTAASLAGIAIERKQADEVLLRNMERFQIVARATNDAVWDWDLATNAIWWNDGYQTLFGYRPDEIRPGIESWYDQIHPEDQARVVDGIHSLIDSGGQSWNDEYRFRRRDGTYAYIYDRGFVIHDPNAKAVRMIGAMQDVTGRTEAESALREAEDRYRRLVELSPDAVLIHQDLKYVYLNRASVALLGAARPEDLLGRSVLDFVPPEFRDLIRERIRMQVEDGKTPPPMEQTYLRADGSRVEVDVSSAPFAFRGKPAVQVIARDITERKRAALSIAEMQARYRQLVELSPDAIHIHQDGKLVFVNSACVRLFGATSPEQLIGRPLLDFIHPEQRKKVQARMRVQYEEQRVIPGMEQKALRLDGSIVDVEIKSAPFTFEGRPAIQTVVRDITERKRGEDALRQFRAAMDLSPDLILLVDRASMRFVDVNGTTCSVLGYTREEMLALGPHDVAPVSRDELARLYDRVIAGDSSVSTVEMHHRRKDGSLVPVELFRCAVPSLDGNIVVIIARDITERKKNQERLTYLAQYDTLTNLPNRGLFRDRLEQAMLRAKRHGQMMAVLFIDIDRFKEINDTLGHLVGDIVLQMIAERLKRHVRDVDTIARLGGDEYTLILEEITQVSQAEAVAAKILSALPEPIVLEGREIFVSASIGIAIYPSDALDIEDLMKRADVAMYQAKHEGRNTYVLYSAGLQMPSSERLDLEASLRRALKQKEFVLHYQPKIELRTGLIVGAEALIRWDSKSRGLVPPNQFISLAEETGLIIELGEWVLRTACRQHQIWDKLGFGEFTMAVNLSPRQLKHKDIMDVISSALMDSGLRSNLLELEITEGMLMQKGVDDLLTRLIDMGVHLSIDDFGTGYANLAYLKRFRVQNLKIDKSFVDGIQTSTEDSAIITAIIGMAKALGIKLIAEGVESEQQAQFLLRLDCEYGQGYFFGRPVPAEAFAENYFQNRRKSSVGDIVQPRGKKPI
ncbi:MAG TPA: PAS domain S-box protein [Burkholderiales bacterium]|nr:PAS domain S-box protein [Burkholderiales bacterium]